MRLERLQSNQVKRTPLDSINESIIWKLNPLVVSSIQIRIRFLIGLYEQCMKPENQETRKPEGKTPLNISRAAILDLCNSGFSKKADFSWFTVVNAYCQKENSPF